MKIRVIAILLMLTMLASVLIGCGGKKDTDETTTKDPGTTQTPGDNTSTPDDTGSTPGDDTDSTPGDDTGSTPGDDTDSTPGDDTDNPGDEAYIPEGLLVLADKGLSDYTIVYPQMKDWTKDYADLVAERLFEKTGAQLAVKHDSEKGANEYEIRVGEVKGNRLEVLEAYKSFKEEGVDGDLDFAVHVEGNTIYVYGTNSHGVASAVDYLLEKVLLFGDTYLFAAIDPAHSTMYSKDENPALTVTGSDENYVYFSIGKGTITETFARISYTGHGGWRIQTKGRASEPFDDFGAAQRLAYSLGEEDPSKLYPIRVEESGKDGLFTAYEDDTNSYVTFDVENFVISFYDAEGDLANSIIDLYASAGGGYIEGTLLENEAIFGTGEKFNTSNQRGKTLQMVSKDIWSSENSCYVIIPLMCLSRGSGIFINRYEAMELYLDSAKKPTNTWNATIKSAQVDCYIYTTDSAAEVIKGYCELTGYAEQPEEWTYGMLLCRFAPDLSQKWSVDITIPDRYGSSDDGNDANGKETADGRGVGVYDVIAKMEAYDLPWTGILAEPWGTYAGSKHDDLKELCDYTHSLGKKFLVYIAVGGGGIDGANGYLDSYVVTQTNPDGSLSYLLPDTQDIDGGNPDNAGSLRRYLDVTNPAAVDWFFGEYWDYLTNEVGVDGCKIDFCELMPESDINLYDNDVISDEGTHHWYPVAFCARFWEMLQQKPDSGMCYIRGGGIGLQRSPYVWAGDQKRVFSSLELQLNAILSAGLSGIPFISYDMSGYEYMGGRALNSETGSNYASSFRFTQDPGRSLAYESQVFLRGLQFTAFTLCMQTHGTVRWVYEFAEDGDVIYDRIEDADGNVSYKMRLGADGNPVYDVLWQRDATTGKILTDASGQKIPVLDAAGNVVTVTPGTYAYVVDVYRAYVKLHELLAPYLTEMSAIACEDGIPVMRHLVFGWQDDANVYNIDDEYTLGDAFLVAPVVTGGTSRDIYLPEGEWLDLNTGALYEIAGGVCKINGEEVESNSDKGYTIAGYEASVVQLPVFYNLNNTSETAEELLPGMLEIFEYLNEVDASIPAYLKTVLQ